VQICFWKDECFFNDLKKVETSIMLVWLNETALFFIFPSLKASAPCQCSWTGKRSKQSDFNWREVQ